MSQFRLIARIGDTERWGQLTKIRLVAHEKGDELSDQLREDAGSGTVISPDDRREH